MLRALEKNGHRLLNDGKRGRDRDRSTTPHMAHLTATLAQPVSSAAFDFSQASLLLRDLTAAQRKGVIDSLGEFCADLTNRGEPYTREALIELMGRAS